MVERNTPAPRHNHFAVEASLEDAPIVHPVLVEWLLKRFAIPPPKQAECADDVVVLVTGAARLKGQRDVIDYLQSLVKE